MTEALSGLWPKRLYAQLLIVAAFALLVAQLLNGYLLLNGLKKRAEFETATILVTSYINRAERTEFMNRRGYDQRGDQRGDQRADQRAHQRGHRRKRAVVYFDRNTDIRNEGFVRNGELTERAADMIDQNGIDPSTAGDVSISIGDIEDLSAQDKEQLRSSRVFRRIARHAMPMPREAMVLLVRNDDGEASRSAIPIRPVDPGAKWMLLLQTLLLYIAVLVPLALAARRMSRPLGALQTAMQRFGPGMAGERLTPAGPLDVRDLITAYNELQDRIAQLLSEKDVMLGAIGHDLKTPLASLRLRVENADDAEERAHMVNTIAEMTAMLDDILTLARLGKSGEAEQQTDIAALIETVLDDFPGHADDIAFHSPDTRLSAPVRPMLLRRALRNVIGNALRYGGDAEISVEVRDGLLDIIVDDHGAGMPADKIEEMFEPFARGDSSRNRQSGGSGLGLTIARAIASSHGGNVVMQRRAAGGIRAILSVRWNGQA